MVQNMFIDDHILCSKNSFGVTGLACVIDNLAYNPVLEDLRLTELNVTSAPDGLDALSFALNKLFERTVSLKKVGIDDPLVSVYVGDMKLSLHS